MTLCEDKNCRDEARRRFRCWHCGLLVCRWCWHHLHRCEPNHARADCRDLKSYRTHGKQYIERLRARGEYLRKSLGIKEEAVA